MSDDTKTITAIDPETGEEDTVTFPTSVNGWEYESKRTGPPITWVHPDDESIYIAWEKTGGQSWSAWVNVPGTIPKDTIYRSFGSPERALDEAETIMERYTPQQAEEKWA